MSRKPIEPGCHAITFSSGYPENNFKIVTVGNYIGEVDECGFKGLWEVNQLMKFGNFDNSYIEYNKYYPESHLQRIDDNDENELTEQLIEEEDNV